jgi:Domain of unknown function (DUF4260)
VTAQSAIARPATLQEPHLEAASQTDAAVALGDGIVTGEPRRWLRIEGATLLVGSLIAYSATRQPWWLIPLTLLVPDLSMVGYLGGNRVGARIYNVAHCAPMPAIMVGLGWWQAMPLVLALGLVWFAHLGMDGLLGYGLKYDDHFQHTHLGWIGRSRRPGSKPTLGPVQGGKT